MRQLLNWQKERCGLKEKIKLFVQQHKLRIYLLVVNGLIACVPLLIVSMIFFNLTVGSINDSLSDNFNMTFTLMKKNVDSFLETVNTISTFAFFNTDVMNVLEHDPGLTDFESVRTLRQKTMSVFSLNSSLRSIYVITSENRVGGSERYGMNNKMLEFVTENAQKIADKNISFFVPSEGEFSDSVVIVRHIKSMENFKKVGLGVVVVNKQKLINSVYLPDRTHTSEFCVFDDRDNFIMASEEGGKIAAEIAGKDLSGEKTVNIDGTTYYFMEKSEEKAGWRFVMLMPKKELYGQMERMKYIILLALLAALGISVTGTVVFNTSVVDQIKILTEGIDSVARGDSKVRIHFKNYNEITSIAHNFNEMVQKNKELNRKIFCTQQKLYETELEKTRVELYMLQTQINSHFLYNTLGTIRVMARKGDKQGVDSMISCVVSILRYAAKKQECVPIASELENLRNYMYIQEIRNSKIKFDICCKIDPEKYYIQKLMLQPIVENAITAFGGWSTAVKRTR